MARIRAPNDFNELELRVLRNRLLEIEEVCCEARKLYKIPRYRDDKVHFLLDPKRIIFYDERLAFLKVQNLYSHLKKVPNLDGYCSENMFEHGELINYLILHYNISNPDGSVTILLNDFLAREEWKERYVLSLGIYQSIIDKDDCYYHNPFVNETMSKHEYLLYERLKRTFAEEVLINYNVTKKNLNENNNPIVMARKRRIPIDTMMKFFRHLSTIHSIHRIGYA